MARSLLVCLVSVLVIASNSESSTILDNFGHIGNVGTYLGGEQENVEGDKYGDTDVGMSELHEETDEGEQEHSNVGDGIDGLYGQLNDGTYTDDSHGQTSEDDTMSGHTDDDEGGLHGQINIDKYMGALRKPTDTAKYLGGLHGHTDISKYMGAMSTPTDSAKHLGGLQGHPDVGKFIGTLRGATPLGKFLGSSKLKTEMPIEAIAVLTGQHVHGELRFFQVTSTSPVVISGEIHGLSPGDHGMHVHVYGDFTHGCESNGPHFNPYNKEHGSPKSPMRHLGDLGNIKADAHGVAKVFKIDKVISLKGPHSIVGRSMVVHENPDDLGKGGDEESKESGNSGGRLACGLIQLHHQGHGLH